MLNIPNKHSMPLTTMISALVNITAKMLQFRKLMIVQ